jgi:hypothetical protein
MRHGYGCRPIALALFMLVAPACGDGTAVLLTVRAEGSLSDADVRSIDELDFTVTGVEYYTRQYLLQRSFSPSRQEVVLYKSSSHGGRLNFVVQARDGRGVEVATSVETPVDLKDQRTVSVTVSLGHATSLDLGANDGPPDAIPPPRPIAPQGFSVVTQLRPTLKWELPAGVTGAHVQLCSDPGCNSPIGEFDAFDKSGTPVADLPTQQAVFWRLRGLRGATVGTAFSPTWQFRTPKTNATRPVDTSYGITLDVNGDGYADVAVGAPNAANGIGRVYLILGSRQGPAHTFTAIDEPNGLNLDSFGSTLAPAGDVDGDGYGDLIVGAPAAPANGATQMGGNGRAYVFFGSPDGISTSRKPITLVSPDEMTQQRVYFGNAVSSAGDVDGDGYADVVVSQPDDLTLATTGSVLVFRGGPNGTLATVASVLSDPMYKNLGSSVAEAGDVNGDGYDDVIVGSVAGGISPQDGHALVFLGGPNGLGLQPHAASLLLGVPSGAEYLGATVAGGGDVNHDGYADVVVGAPQAIPGKAYVWLGGAGGLGQRPAPAHSLSSGDTAGCGFAQSGLTMVEDFDRDGMADIVVGCVGKNARAYLFTSDALSMTSPMALTAPKAILQAAPSDGSFGAAVRGGDFDNSGDSDLFIGCPDVSNLKGAAYLFPGQIVLDPRTVIMAGFGAMFDNGSDSANGQFGQAL